MADATVWRDVLAHAEHVHPDEFLFRSAPHLADRESGLSVLWLSSNEGWKKRVTERISIPRTDTLETTIELDVDVAQIRRHGVEPDAAGLYWLPLLASGYEVPSTRRVTDETGAKVRRATSAEVRWQLAAALASLTVRSEPQFQRASNSRDVTLLLAAALRRYLELGSHGDHDFSALAEESWSVDPHSRSRTRDRIQAASEVIGLRDAEGAVRRPADPPQFARLALGLAGVLRDKRFLVVGVDASVSSKIFTCEVPSRTIDVAAPRWLDHLTSIERVVASGGRHGAGWARRHRASIRRRLYNRTKTHGPAVGRAILEIDLLAFSSARNYHVRLDLPQRTQCHRPRVVVDWDEDDLLDHFRSQVRSACDAVAAADGVHRWGADRWRTKEVDSIAERRLADLDLASRELDRHLALVTSGDLGAPDGTLGATEAADVRPDEHLLTLTERRDHAVALRQDLRVLIKMCDPGAERRYSDLVELLEKIATRLQHLAGPVGATREDSHGWATQVFEGVQADHPEAVHIGIPSSDLVTRGLPVRKASLLTGIYLGDPRPHTPSNLVNLINGCTIGVLATFLLVVQALRKVPGPPSLEVDALVTVLVLFVSVQASRLERRGRVTLDGWLAVMPFLLGLLSPLPAVLFAIWAASGGLAVFGGWGYVANLVVTAALALLAQSYLLALGIHAGREASYWDPVERARRATQRPLVPVLSTSSTNSAVKALRRWLRRRTRDKLGLGTTDEVGRPVSVVDFEVAEIDAGLGATDRPPRQRLLGLAIRSLWFGSVWFVPLLRTTQPVAAPDERDPNQDVARLLSRELQDLLQEAMAQAPLHSSEASLVLWMRDEPGRLLGIAEQMQSDGLRLGRRLSDPPMELPPLDISGTLGVSYAGYAILHLLAADASGGQRLERFLDEAPAAWLSSRHGRRRLEPNLGRGWGVERAEQDVDPRELPLRVVREIVEILIPGDIADLSLQLETLATLARSEGIFVLLGHLPTVPPPRQPADCWQGSTWMRVRLGVPHGRELALDRLIERFLRTRTDPAGVRIRSVAEFARPTSTDVGILRSHTDPSASLEPGRPVTFLMVQAGIGLGMVSSILQRVRHSIVEMHPHRGRAPIPFQGCSFTSILGRCLATFYFDADISRNAIADLEDGLRAVPGELVSDGRAFDRHAEVFTLHAPAWPRPREDATAPHPALRVTWSCPNVPGVFLQLLRAIDDERSSKPNLSYVLSRVRELNSYSGRLVIQLEGAGLGDQTALIERLHQRMTQRLTDHVQAVAPLEDPFSLRSREVFITLDPFT